MSTSLDVLTVVSNAWFILPAVESARQRLWTLACIYVLVGVNSGIYHTCNSFYGACAGLPAEVPRMMDFFSAQLTIPLTALLVIHFPLRLYWAKRVIIVLFAFSIFLLLQFFGTAMAVQLSISGVSFALIVVYWITYACVHGRLPPYRWDYFALAIGLLSLSSTLYVVQMIMPSFYWAIHSVWHVNAANGQFILLLIWPPDDPDRKIPARYIALDKERDGAKSRRHVHRRDVSWRTRARPSFFDTFP